MSFNAPHVPVHAPPRKLLARKLAEDATPAEQYRAMIEAVDSELSRFLREVDPQVLADTTIVLMGDNGTPEGAIEPPFDADRSKGSMFEGGIRAPLVISGPHVAEPGTISDALVHAVDILPRRVQPRPDRQRRRRPGRRL